MQRESEAVLTDIEMELCPFDITAWETFIVSGSELKQNMCSQFHVRNITRKLCWILSAVVVIFNVHVVLKAATALVARRLSVITVNYKSRSPVWRRVRIPPPWLCGS
jgi:hypothetical protein